MTDISKHTLDKIKKENIHPIPRYFFFFRRSILWSLFAISILLGSIASGIAIFLLKHAEWDVYQHLGRSFFGFLLLVVPYVWLIFLLGFSIFAFVFFRRTEQGYRYKTVWIICLSILFSIFGGGILYKTNLPEKLERMIQENIPLYRGLEYHKHFVWMSPSRGLLAGEIVRILSNDTVQIKDFNGKIWDINIADTIWRGRMGPVKNLKIKIIGRQEGKDRFIAKEVRPWEGKQQRGRQRGNGRGRYR